MTYAKLFIILGALSAAMSVGLGAFAAHALKDSLSPRMLEVFQTGVQYQMMHSLGLILLGALALQGMKTHIPASLMTLAIVLFSGSLYGLALTGAKWLGPITPIGGLLFIASWLWFTWLVFQYRA
jgi:uncharacterized membrane protein YgdD (TMEM256/DUF423 family)